MIVFVTNILVIILGALILKSYEKGLFQGLEKREHRLVFFYPLGWFLWKKLFGRNKETIQRKKEELRGLYVKEDSARMFALYQAKRMSSILFLILIFHLFAIILSVSGNKDSQLVGEKYIERPGYGEMEKSVDLHVIIRDQDQFMEHDLSIDVGPRQYSLEEFNQAVDQAEEYLNLIVKGENNSYEAIYYPLVLPSEIPDTGLTVKWTLDDSELIQSDGRIQNETIDKAVEVTIIAKVETDTMTAEYPMTLTLLPLTLSKDEKLYYGLTKAISDQAESSSTKERIELPTNIGEMEVIFQENKTSKAKLVMFLGTVASIILYLGMDKRLKEQRIERDEQSMLDYPEIINKFTLLLGAGMTMKRAWGKIVTDYESAVKNKKKKKRYAYEELSLTWNQLKNGVNEAKAYESFGRRMKLLPYMKFSSLLVQNGAKGMDGLFYVLQKEAMDAFEERKEFAKRLGEKAGTKLLFPMMLMLGVVLIMIIVPAAISF